MTTLTIDASQAKPNLLTDTRIRLIYLARHGRLPNLHNPKTFTELVQYRKRFDRDPRLPLLADKIAVKSYVKAKLGQEWIIPNLWTGTRLPAAPKWPTPSVLKSSHGWNQIEFLRAEPINWDKLRRRTEKWMKTTHGKWLDEWLYEHIKPRLLVEPYVGSGDTLPVDYKFYVFGGEVTLIQVHLGRGSNHRWMLLDRNWKRVSRQTEDFPKQPESLQVMIAAAEVLGREFDFVRVDLYEPNGKPLFGEMTFYPGSGYDRFDPAELDWAIGEMWLKALRSSIQCETRDELAQCH